MRRLTAVAFGCLVALSACTSDNTSPAPTEPGPDAAIAARCRPAPFPFHALTVQAIKIFPVQGGLQAKALLSEAAIGALWTVCKPTEAQKGVAAYVKWMVQLFQAGKLIGGKSDASSQRVRTHTDDNYRAVGLTPPNFPPEALGDANNFGNGLFTPGQQAVIKTGNGEGSTVIPPNGFNEATLITIFKRQTSGFPTPPQPVFEPFFEVTASNASGTHYLTTGQFAVVGFCADADFLASLNDPAIAHQAVAEGANPGGFEILDDATAQYNSLGLACPQFPGRLGALDMGSFKGFAMSAWKRATRYAGPVLASALLPDEAQAASAMVVGKSGLGGLARSLSPFAVTDRVTLHLEFFQSDAPFGGDVPGEHTFDLGALPTIKWCQAPGEGCSVSYPSVILRDGEGTPIGGVEILATLVNISGHSGVFTTTGDGATDSTVATATFTSSGFSEEGVALFDRLSITSEGLGTYQLTFSVPSMPDIEPITTRVFDADFID